MFFKRADWASNGFPRELFHDSRSKRGGVLMHSKVRPAGSPIRSSVC